jgi:cellobiose-specific phosphotransferase system component IIA
MEKKAENTGNTEVTAIYSLTRKVLAFFNLGDVGKVDSFVGKLVKDFERAITKNKQLLAIKANSHVDVLAEIDEKLEDAQEQLNEAWLNIPMDKVATHDAQNNYKEDYLNNIEAIERVIEGLEKDRKGTVEAYDKYVEETTKLIEAAETRIAKIKSL